MSKPFLKKIMKNNPPLFDAIVAFNSSMAETPVNAAKRATLGANAAQKTAAAQGKQAAQSSDASLDEHGTATEQGPLGEHAVQGNETSLATEAPLAPQASSAEETSHRGETASPSNGPLAPEASPFPEMLSAPPVLGRLTPAGKTLATSGLMELMAASPRGRRHIAALLPQLVQNPPRGWYLNFTSDRSRLALLAPKTLHNLALHFGLAVHAKDIARCIARTEVQAIKAAFGENAYLFAVKRAPFLTGDCSSLLPAIGAGELPEMIRAHGYLGIALCFAREPLRLRKRLAMKLPKIFFSTHGIKDLTTADAVWPALKRILLSEVAPEWAPCFA